MVLGLFKTQILGLVVVFGFRTLQDSISVCSKLSLREKEKIRIGKYFCQQDEQADMSCCIK